MKFETTHYIYGCGSQLCVPFFVNMQGRDILQSTVDLVQDQLDLEVCYIL